MQQGNLAGNRVQQVELEKHRGLQGEVVDMYNSRLSISSAWNVLASHHLGSYQCLPMECFVDCLEACKALPVP